MFPDINLQKKADKTINNTWMSPDDQHVYIKKGEILTGTITSNHVGKGKAGAIIHVIQRDLGPEATKIFMSDL